MATATTSNDPTDLYQQLDAYDWDNDPEFQGGLQAILGSAQSPSQIKHLTLRAKCYYYARKVGTKIDFDGYQGWLQTQSTTSTNGSSNLATTLEGPPQQTSTNTLGQPQEPDQPSDQPSAQPSQPPQTTSEEASPPSQQEQQPSPYSSAPAPASFAEICELIASGKPIPGIKEIPDTILEGQGTRPAASRRKKPWEKEGASEGGVSAAATDDVSTPSWA